MDTDLGWQPPIPNKIIQSKFIRDFGMLWEIDNKKRETKDQVEVQPTRSDHQAMRPH